MYEVWTICSFVSNRCRVSQCGNGNITVTEISGTFLYYCWYNSNIQKLSLTLNFNIATIAVIGYCPSKCKDLLTNISDTIVSVIEPKKLTIFFCKFEGLPLVRHVTVTAPHCRTTIFFSVDCSDFIVALLAFSAQWISSTLLAFLHDFLICSTASIHESSQDIVLSFIDSS